MTSRRHPPARRAAGVLLLHAVLLLGGVAMVFPFYWMLATSFKTQAETLLPNPTLWPRHWSPGNYAQVWNEVPMGRYLLNSLFVSTSVTLGVLVTSALAAHAFARMRFPGRNVVFGLFLATMMIPFEVLIIPDFIIVHDLGWYDSYKALIVPWCASVFGIFLLRQAFLAVPLELHEAARLDGCGHTRYLWSVAAPVSLPALITVGIVSFLGSWNSLLWPLLVTQTQSLRPVQVGIAAFNSEAGSAYHLSMAAATISILPIVALFLLAQRHFVEGISRSGLKS